MARSTSLRGPTRTVKLPRPHASQRNILAEAGRFNVVNCGRRFGKTVLGINLACEAALPRDGSPGLPVGWFAPEYKLLREAWRDMNALLAPVIASSNSQERRIELVNGAVIECWAFDRSPNAGRSRKYRRVVIDEAAHCENLEQTWTKGVRPTLTDYRGDAWFLSSPNGPNFFASLYDRGQDPARPTWRSWTRTTFDNPHIDPAEVEEARLDLPDWVFQQEYLAVFHKESHGQLVPESWADRMAEAARGRGFAGRRGIAADLSKGTGGDRFVAFVFDALGILDCVHGNRIGLPEAAAVVARLAGKWDVPQERIVYDAGGLGDDFPRYLQQYRIDAAIGYRGGLSGGSRFANLRAACGWKLRRRLDPERPRLLGAKPEDAWNPLTPARHPSAQLQPPFVLPEPPADRSWWPKLREEILALRYAMKGPKVALENKDEMAARLGRSPDFVDALLMAMALDMGLDAPPAAPPP